MTTATRTRKMKPARKVHVYPGSMPIPVELTIGEREYFYLVEPIPADFGLGFSVRKLIADGGEVYHVNIDLEHGRHTCDCKGGTYHGHCKHQESILALIRAGKLPTTEKPATPSAPKPSTPAPVLPLPAPMKPAAALVPVESPARPAPAKPHYCRHCGCPESDHAAGCCPC